MLLYKNHRFHCQGVSFTIPEGFYLDTSYDDIHQDTLNLWTKDRSLYICISVQRETQGTHQELSLILRELEDILVTGPIKPISLGGLSGYSAAYTSGPKYYWETHLHISGKGSNQIELLLLLRSKDTLLSDETISTIINQIDVQTNFDIH